MMENEWFPNMLYQFFKARIHPEVLSHTKCFEVVSQKSIPTQIRQLILYISNSKGWVDGFVGELTSAKRIQKHFCKRYNPRRKQ